MGQLAGGGAGAEKVGFVWEACAAGVVCGGTCDDGSCVFVARRRCNRTDSSHDWRVPVQPTTMVSVSSQCPCKMHCSSDCGNFSRNRCPLLKLLVRFLFIFFPLEQRSMMAVATVDSQSASNLSDQNIKKIEMIVGMRIVQQLS